MTEELKPCPFCGSSHLFSSTNTLNQVDYINCAQCGARHPAAKWNTRAESEGIVSLRKLRDNSIEIATLRARIAELEAENFKLAAGQCVHSKGIIGDDYGNATCPLADKQPIDAGYVIVNENPPVVCYNVHDTINEAWEAHIGEASKHEGPEFLRIVREGAGDRAVKVAVVRVEE